MSADPPECANDISPNPLAMYCKTPNYLKSYTSMFKNRFTPPNVCMRSICRQCNYHYCFADKVIILCYY